MRELAERLLRADGLPYSPSFVSRLERGWASPSLWSYIQVAEIFEVPPGRLLGPEEMDGAVTEPELSLVRVVRRLGLEPEAAIVRLVRPE